MRCYPVTLIYYHLSVQLILLLTVQGLPLNQQYDLMDPVPASSSSAAADADTGSSSSGLIPPEPEPANLVFDESLPMIKKSDKMGSTSSLIVNRHHPLHFLIGRVNPNSEIDEGQYQRGRRYREHDKSFIRFGRAAVQRALALWSRESRKRPEQNNDTYFLRFGRSTDNKY